jgi:trk system potassium uptake protein TrkA
MEERLTRVVVKSNSVLVGKRIGELELAAKMGVDIIAVRRGKEVVVNPKKGEMIKKEDIITARGAPGGVEEFEKLAEGILQKLES